MSRVKKVNFCDVRLQFFIKKNAILAPKSSFLALFCSFLPTNGIKFRPFDEQQKQHKIKDFWIFAEEKTGIDELS